MTVFDACDICGGYLQELGKLGCKLYLKCRQCGMAYSKEEPREEQEEVTE